MSKKVDIIRSLVIIVITSVLMFTTTFTIYGTITKPAFYTQFMTMGSKYLSEGNYEEAILEFQKAIKIEGKSIQARIGLAKGSIEIDDIDTAVRALKEAQKIDFENKDLLKEIIDILKDVDPNAAYEILMNYVNKYGEDHIDSDIKDLLASSKEKPQIPQVLPPSGTYIKPFSIRLKSDKVRIGHSFYYTTNEKEPDNKDAQYRGSIKIEQDIHVKFRGYNPAGEHTDVFEVDYIIDTALETQIKNIITTSKSEMDQTEVGTEVGNCIEGSKEELQKALDKGNDLLNKNAVSLEDGTKMYNLLNQALETFRSQIIVPTERGELEREISRAEQLVQSAIEGNAVGQYRNGAKNILNTEIAAAKRMLENLVARQENIDNAKNELFNSISRFEAKKITEIDKIIEETGAKIGPVTVSLLWNTNDDLDLHVTSPNGDTINYRNKTGSSGGKLDVDRQVSSFVANPVENIYWQNPPHGTYTVKVNMYSKRTEGNVSFRVRLIVDGEAKFYDMTINTGTSTVCTFTY